MSLIVAAIVTIALTMTAISAQVAQVGQSRAGSVLFIAGPTLNDRYWFNDGCLDLSAQ
jgi:hypothetical protein